MLCESHGNYTSKPLSGKVAEERHVNIFTEKNTVDKLNPVTINSNILVPINDLIAITDTGDGDSTISGQRWAVSMFAENNNC